jgi:hypothetical protein
MSSGDVPGDLSTQGALRSLPQGGRGLGSSEEEEDDHAPSRTIRPCAWTVRQGRRHSCAYVVDRSVQSRGPSVPPQRAPLGGTPLVISVAQIDANNYMYQNLPGESPVIEDNQGNL